MPLTLTSSLQRFSLLIGEKPGWLAGRRCMPWTQVSSDPDERPGHKVSETNLRGEGSSSACRSHRANGRLAPATTQDQA